ncbi:hypothetical protein BGX33_000269 [Mortierella sp. NVP41]|nr:hypothetical protein BGX33_000269 [Mortierella sp. NVP41]
MAPMVELYLDGNWFGLTPRPQELTTTAAASTNDDALDTSPRKPGNEAVPIAAQAPWALWKTTIPADCIRLVGYCPGLVELEVLGSPGAPAVSVGALEERRGLMVLEFRHLRQ